jgi:hypothetical protein
MWLCIWVHEINGWTSVLVMTFSRISFFPCISFDILSFFFFLIVHCIRIILKFRKEPRYEIFLNISPLSHFIRTTSIFCSEVAHFERKKHTHKTHPRGLNCTFWTLKCHIRKSMHMGSICHWDTSEIYMIHNILQWHIRNCRSEIFIVPDLKNMEVDISDIGQMIFLEFIYETIEQK